MFRLGGARVLLGPTLVRCFLKGQNMYDMKWRLEVLWPINPFSPKGSIPEIAVQK